ncbi:hypothetical protein GH714_008562 [Hevea brasiliensis]|uniref:Vacuolar membrane protease n=1 Tax=Hevea brasiliensis TaxID=3981 RepID=A0A6A6MXL4_HEVBR|nr:hypothetical protein GH714_008562 [Hevea brasiliensis]
MRRRPNNSSSKSEPSTSQEPIGVDATGTANVVEDAGLISGKTRRSGFVWLILFGVIIYSSWAVYYYQFESLPLPLTAEQAGKRVFLREGAGDCSSCVGVMLELARGISQWAHGFKNAIIFLFNTGEEEGLNGAHSFITQAGPHPFAIENFALAAKYPSGHIVAQDLFSSGVIKSATDFQVYKEVAGLSGLDFAYTDNSGVYHTKNDKLEFLKSGSLQHLGENMLAFLLQIAPTSHLPKGKAMREEEKSGHDNAVFFDILGTYMIVYNQRFASILHNSVIMQSLLIWVTSLLMGGYPAAISLVLSSLSAILMLVFSISFSVLVAFILPQISSSPVPYVGNPWLVVGLFAAPALIGALIGQHFGYLVLQMYLSNVYSKKKQLSSVVQAELVKLEAERWLFKAGFIQWLVLLILGHYYKIGSSYMALFWLVPPAFACKFLFRTFNSNPSRLPRPLKLATLLTGMAVPIIISAGTFIRLAATLIGIVVRFDRNPGSTPEWLGNIIIAVFVAVIICFTLIYVLSYVHLSGAKRTIILATSVLVGLSLILILSGIVPPFTEDNGRAVNVVHVVDTTGSYGNKQDPTSYISLFSTTPGKLTKEDTKGGWSDTDIPALHVESDTKGDERITQVSIDTKVSIRWSLAINTEEVEDFILTGVCRASQVVELFSTVSQEIVVREARLEDCWEVAETHCSSFFPEYSFTLDFVLRIDRLVAMLSGFSMPPNGCKRTCLVAVIGSSGDGTFCFGSEDFKIGGFDGKFSLSRNMLLGY